ncbi:MAG: hypothetical protein NTX61_08700 [Bacteroidetes bacterium]|nr:hypothetical protein [Bacteroidota bacterium]
MNNWSKLYTLANRIYALKPWRFMYEDEIIGIRDPVTGTIGFISVMGNLGEHYALTVYMGERALGQFLELSENGPDASPDMVLEIPQLMLSFENREYIQKEDRAVMKELGITFSGKKSWPMFRCFRPGMIPWFFEESEQESMVNFLEQFLEVAISPESHKRDANSGSNMQDVFLVREYKKVGENRKWRDTYKKILIPSLEELSIPINSELLNKARNTSHGKNIYEIDFFLTPAQVREKNKRPYFSYLLLIVDQQSELVISSEVMNPSDGIENMLAQIPGILLKTFSKRTSLPRVVYTATHRLADVLFPLMKNLGIRLQFKPRLRSLEMAKSSIVEYFSGR